VDGLGAWPHHKFRGSGSRINKTDEHRYPLRCDPAGIDVIPRYHRWMDAASLHFFMTRRAALA
jgi:hypothetical protein